MLGFLTKEWICSNAPLQILFNSRVLVIRTIDHRQVNVCHRMVKYVNRVAIFTKMIYYKIYVFCYKPRILFRVELIRNRTVMHGYRDVFICRYKSQQCVIGV